MYWWLEEKKDRPIAQIVRLRKLDETKGLDTLEEEELQRIHQLLVGVWNNAQGRYLYIPNRKEQEFFLSPKMIRAISGGNRDIDVETDVRMADGSIKKIKNISVGDYVLGYDLDTEQCVPTRVVSTMNMGINPCYEITTKNGRSCVVSDKHPTPIITRRLRSYKRGLIDCDKSHHNAIDKPFLKLLPKEIATRKNAWLLETQEYHYMNRKPLPFDGLLLGLYLGDGSYGNSPSNGYAKPFFTNEKQEIRELFASHVRGSYPDLYCNSYESDPTKVFVCCSGKGKHRFVKDLNTLGLKDKKAHDKFIPNIYKYSDCLTRKEILRGLILTDGCVQPERTDIYSNSLKMLQDVQEILTGLGAFGTIYKYGSPANENQNQQYVIRFATKFLFSMEIGHLYHKQPTPKKTRFSSANRRDLLIDSVKYVGERETCCIEIDNPSHVFILANGMPTCNSGKTATCVMDAVMQCEGWHPLQRNNLKRLMEEAKEKWVRERCKYLYENKFWIKDPPVKWRCVSIDFPNFVEKVVGAEYEKWSTRELVKEFAYGNDKKRKIIWKNKSQVEFMTYEQPVLSHGGAALDGIHFDEESTEGHWQQGLMRVVSTKGRLIMGMTAEQGVTWTEDQIFTPGEQGHPDIFVMEMSTYENPINSKAVVEKIKAQCLDEAEVQIRIYGKRANRGGNVFKTYKQEKPWVIEPFAIPADEGMLLASIDPHPQIPHAVAWMWVDFNGIYHPLYNGKPNLYIVAEMFEPGHIPYLTSMMRLKEHDLGRAHDLCMCDPSAWNKHQADEHSKSVFEQLTDNGVYPIKGSKDLAGGIIKMNEMFALDMDAEGTTRDHPQLMIFNTCDRFLWELKNYRWQPPPRTRQGEGRSPKQKPVDKDDHLVEAVRRMCEYVYDGELEVFESVPKRPQLSVNGQLLEVNWDDKEEDNWVRLST